MDDRDRLAGYVETWWDAVHDLVTVLDDLPDEEWRTPTDLAGWDVHACAAHVAHLEGVLAGRPEETAEVGEPPHVTGLMGRYTEIGVHNRRDHAPADVLAEIREVTALRRAQLLDDPPTDGAARPETVFGGVPWSWETLLRNRPLDVWMHSQDVRRAVGRPGGLDSPAARHTADYLGEGFGYVLAKKAGAPAGTTAVLDVAGSPTRGFAVDDAGRGQPLPEPPADPTVTVRMDREAFVVLAGGRRTADEVVTTTEGDADLAARILAAMATTP